MSALLITGAPAHSQRPPLVLGITVSAELSVLGGLVRHRQYLRAPESGATLVIDTDDETLD